MPPFYIALEACNIGHCVLLTNCSFVTAVIMGSRPGWLDDCSAISSDGDEHDADNDVHALILKALALPAPHAVLLIIPERSRCRVHTSPGGSASARRVLNDRAVHGELVL